MERDFLMNKTKWIVLVCVLLVGAAVWYGWDGKGGSETAGASGGRRGMDGRPMPVVAIEARRGDMDVLITALGTVTARNTTVVKARVAGLLQRIAFQEGQLVKAGDLLAEIDPRPFQAQLDQAVGQLTRDQALLANAKIDLERYRALQAQDSIAKQQVDTQAALVKQYEGTVQIDKGNVDNARLQLAFARITAPIAGRLGLRQVDVGNMVNTTDANGIVVITQTQPIMAVFAIPGDSLGAVLKSAQSGDALPVEAWDRDNKIRLALGKLLSVDNQIDTATGTVKLKAEFANADNALFPNQFVNVRLRVETRHDAILIPLAAVQRGTPGTFVYVVNREEKKVAVRPVTLGPNTPETVSVEKGLTAGEQVVVDGADKLRQDAKVELIAPEARQAAARAGADKAGGAGGRTGQGGERGAGKRRTDGATENAPPAPTPGEKPAGEAAQGAGDKAQAKTDDKTDSPASAKGRE